MHGNASPSLADIVTLVEPLGPEDTERLVGTGKDIFASLYDETNAVHKVVRTHDPFFIVGRKGAGKTAFLIGAAFADGAEVVLVRSEDVYLEVNKLATRYSERNGRLVADGLVHVWEVLLFHAAILQIAINDHFPVSEDRRRLWTYISAFSDPAKLEVDNLLAAVGAAITDVLLNHSDGISFRQACQSIDPGRGKFSDAVTWVNNVLADPDACALYVVVDNLEDLHQQLDDYRDVVTALFRMRSLTARAAKERRLPFSARFAFPAELLPSLEILSASPEKDFTKTLTIKWTAQELIEIAGNRLRRFLDLHFPTAIHQLGLPTEHDSRDKTAAEATLRALLPQSVTNALGGPENPVAYIMRHTQLLPRHLIMILNAIFRQSVLEPDKHGVPYATSDHVVQGVHDTERLIVSGILAAYRYQHPAIGKAMNMIKNHIALAQPASDLHRIFNHAKVSRSGLRFAEFIDGCIAVGAFGISRGIRNNRYVQADFSYTFEGQLRPVEDRDTLCVHPLFVSRLFDLHKIAGMQDLEVHPIYPYGSDPQHVDHEV